LVVTFFNLLVLTCIYSCVLFVLMLVGDALIVLRLQRINICLALRVAIALFIIVIGTNAKLFFARVDWCA